MNWSWLALATAMVFAAPQAHATAALSGCAAVHGTWTTTDPFPPGTRGIGFHAGDTITYTNIGAGPTPVLPVLSAFDYTTRTYLGPSISNVGDTGSYVVPADTTHALGIVYRLTPPWSISWSCTPGPAASTGSNIQTSGAQTSGQNANYNIIYILDSVIGGSLGSTFSPVSGGSNGVTMMVAPDQQGQVMPAADAPHTMVSESAWRLWAGGRYIHAFGTETGDQFNGLFGISRRFEDNKAFGLFGGYENFNYVDTSPAQLSGSGGTVGGFVAGELTSRLHLDARVYGTLLNYNIVTGGNTGSFSAQRFAGSVLAAYELGNDPVSFKPYVRGTALVEQQAAYTDSAATAHAAQTLSLGVIAPGVKLSHGIALANGSTLTPYISGEANYALGNNVLAGFSDTQGLSGKASIGATWANAKGISFGLDASYGGIGSTINSQSLMANFMVPF